MPKLSEVHLTKRVVDAAAPGTIAWDNGLRGFGLRVTPAGSKSFVIQYRTENGTQGRFVVGHYPADTVDQAREEARRQLSGLRGGRDPGKARRAQRDAPTFANLAEEYLDSYAVTRKLKPPTIKAARFVLGASLRLWGNRKVAEILSSDIRRAHGDAHQALGKYQANRLLAVLSKMFALAHEMGWRVDNPCKGVKKYPEDQRWRRLSENEVGRLLMACDALDNRNAGEAVKLLLFTGARLQEALKAEWSQFDLETGVWEKPSAHTKTKRQHRLELEGPSLNLLRAMRRENPLGKYLFPGEPLVDASGRITERPRADLKRPWKRLVEAAQLSDVQLHDLRRTTASFMLDGGASLPMVGKALGHTQAATTARYAHLSQSVQREELRKAGERMVALKAIGGTGKVLPLREAGR